MKTPKFNGVKKTTLLAFLAILFLPLAASAYSVKADNSVYVPKGEIVEGNLYAAGANLTIEGKVTGDVICAGQSITISGEVAGDVICAGQTVNVSGKVGGSLRAVGNTVNLSGQVARNAMVFGAAIVTTASSSIGWDMLAGGANVDVFGKVGRDLYGGGANFNLAGEVGKNVNLRIDSRVNRERRGVAFKDKTGLIIASSAVINGDLKYTSKEDADVNAKAVIKGKTVHDLPKVTANRENISFLAGWFGALISIFSALIIGLVLISFWGEHILKITDLMLSKAGLSFGWGVLALLLTPIIVVILLITVIGMPLSLILLALWLIAIYASKILVGILIGRSLLKNYWLKQKDSLILAMIVGIIISYLVFSLPFIGGLAGFLAVLWGLGGIMLALKKS